MLVFHLLSGITKLISATCNSPPDTGSFAGRLLLPQSLSLDMLKEHRCREVVNSQSSSGCQHQQIALMQAFSSGPMWTWEVCMNIVNAIYSRLKPVERIWGQKCSVSEAFHQTARHPCGLSKMNNSLPWLLMRGKTCSRGWVLDLVFSFRGDCIKFAGVMSGIPLDIPSRAICYGIMPQRLLALPGMAHPT